MGFTGQSVKICKFVTDYLIFKTPQIKASMDSSVTNEENATPRSEMTPTMYSWRRYC